MGIQEKLAQFAAIKNQAAHAVYIGIQQNRISVFLPPYGWTICSWSDGLGRWSAIGCDRPGCHGRADKIIANMISVSKSEKVN